MQKAQIEVENTSSFFARHVCGKPFSPFLVNRGIMWRSELSFDAF